ncbi:MAG: hypothetical protein IJZ10_11560 [Thermoguttaceae bacterium]|nr:hypothetical protein [Thermoguttaceae bacterium]
MFDSIWSRPDGEIFLFFAIGTVLAATVCARAALRLGADYPRRRPTLFGAEVGAFLGLAICAYLWASSNPAFDEIDGAALSVWEKARLAGFPTSTILKSLNGTSCEFLFGAAFIVQTTLIGAIWGATGLRRIVVWLEERNQNNDKTKRNEDKS